MVDLPSPLVDLKDERIAEFGVQVYVKRDDLIHPEMSGNKSRKLKYNLSAARDSGCSTLLTFGGAFSNHIRATAAAGHYFGFETIGIIRGEEHLPLNDSLAYAAHRGMRIEYMDRETYRQKGHPDVIAELIAEFGPCYLLPEGGSNVLALRGCAELPGEIEMDFDVICCACGTGGTLAGIAAGLQSDQQHALGFAVLKGGSFLDDEVRRLQLEAFETTTENWSLEYDFHFGGYAKKQPALTAFIEDFEMRHGITLDWVYEAKMMYGLFTRITQGAFAPGTSVVAVLS